MNRILPLIALLLSGCITVRNNAGLAEKVVTVKHDKYAHITNLESAWFMTVPGWSAWFGGSIRDTGQSSMWFRVRAGGHDWKFFDHVIDADGNRIAIEATKHKITEFGTASEEYLVHIDEAYIRSHSSTGFDFKLYGSGGSAIVKITPAFIQGWLARFDTEKERILSAAGNG